MIVLKKHIAAVIIVLIAITIAFLGIKKHESSQTFANDDFTVILDAGHGEPDGGAVGASGTLEKDINLAIVKKTQEVMEGKGIEVILTRDGDYGLQEENADTIRKMKVSDMNRRLDIMENSNADLFLSIHMNSFSDSSVHGLHVFYDKAHPEAEEVAKEIQSSIGKITDAQIHTVKTADEKLFLMKNPPLPAILVECGFLSNPEEEKKLKDEKYQAKIAWAIVKALENYTK